MKKANIQWTGKVLCNQMKKGNINFDCAVQRGLVWDNDKKSLLIHSMIYGYPIPAFYFTRNEDGSYDSLDGKQRSNAIYGFINGEYALSMNTPPVYNEEEKKMEDISGAYFDNLPEWMQDEIKTYSLTIYYFEDIEEEEIRELFRRLNNGKPLNSVEMIRSQAKSIKKFQEIADHSAIQSIVTEKSKARFNHENIAMQCYAMIYMENPDFGAKNFRPYIENVTVTDEQLENIFGTLTYVGKALDYLQEYKSENNNAKIFKKLKNRVNFVSAVYLASLCDREDAFMDMLFKFFDSEETSINSEYNNTVGAGSAKAEAVQTRKRVIKDFFDSYEETSSEEVEDVEESAEEEIVEE